MKYFIRIIPIILLISVSILVDSDVKANAPGETPLPCLNKKFTIVAHVVLDSTGDPKTSEADILRDIDALNRLFDTICVSFEVCEFNYIENYQYDILNEREELQDVRTKNDRNERINMYFIDGLMPDDPICGKASLSGIAQGGFIYILKGCLGTTTIPHEMGHYFGLEHTFEGNRTELVDGSNCASSGDRICDTPADPFFASANLNDYVNGCTFISKLKDVNGDFYNPDVGNIMSYYRCGCEFTEGQYRKMAETYENSAKTNW